MSVSKIDRQSEKRGRSGKTERKPNIRRKTPLREEQILGQRGLLRTVFEGTVEGEHTGGNKGM